MTLYCIIAGCTQVAVSEDCLCDDHRKRRDRRDRTGRGTPLAAPLQQRVASPEERLREAAIRYADAEGDADFRLAERVLLAAARALRCSRCRRCSH